MPVDLRVQSGEDLVKRLQSAPDVEADGVAPEEARGMLAWAHYRLAYAHAQKEERLRVLFHVGEALKPRLPDLNPSSFRDDVTLGAWNGDEEFSKLYSAYDADAAQAAKAAETTEPQPDEHGSSGGD